jgi:hypothetical protein
MAKGTIGERVYRRLLRLYPRDFSDDYADEMTHFYHDRVRGEGAARVWLALVADLARTAPRDCQCQNRCEREDRRPPPRPPGVSHVLHERRDLRVIPIPSVSGRTKSACAWPSAPLERRSLGWSSEEA